MRYNLNKIIKELDIYQFGVYTGKSITEIIQQTNGEYRNLYGFDSFVGLPEEVGDKDFSLVSSNPSLQVGAFSSKELFQTETIEECISKLNNALNADTNRIKFIPGFYKDSLLDKIVNDYDMKPASYIDIDVDIYSSTIECLDFMCRNQLIVPNTLIYFDDLGATPYWQRAATGESLAFKEITDKYKMKSKLLYQAGNTIPGQIGHVSACFKVTEILYN